MANIGGITLDISSISEESNVKLSAHELAVYPHTFGELYRAYATSQRKWQLTTAETSANAGLYRKLETLMKIGKSVKVDLPEIDIYSVGFITSVKLSKTQSAIKHINITIEEGLRNYIHGCDDITDWASNGTLRRRHLRLQRGNWKRQMQRKPSSRHSLIRKGANNHSPEIFELRLGRLLV